MAEPSLQTAATNASADFRGDQSEPFPLVARVGTAVPALQPVGKSEAVSLILNAFADSGTSAAGQIRTVLIACGMSLTLI